MEPHMTLTGRPMMICASVPLRQVLAHIDATLLAPANNSDSSSPEYSISVSDLDCDAEPDSLPMPSWLWAA